MDYILKQNNNIISILLIAILTIIFIIIILLQRKHFLKIIKDGQNIFLLKEKAEQAKENYNKEILFYNKKICEDQKIFEEKINEYNIQYSNILESIKKIIETNKEYNCINITKENQDDIDFLLNHVVSKLSNKNIIYKLIWSEFYQKPVNDMLNYILPFPEVSGIYMITNKNTQQSYIGKSVNVKKRLIDHIKGSIGILNISDQEIHHVMRENGIWNFSFKLIEECTREELSQREKFYINFFKTNIKGYNNRAGG